MKKLLFVLLGFLLFLNSCNRDNDSATSPIVGTWYMYKYAINGTITIDGNVTIMNETLLSNSCEQKNTVTFNQNGTGKLTSWDNSSGTCTQTQSDDFTYTYNASTKALAITINGKVDNSVIESISSTELVKSTTFNKEDLGGGSFTGTVKVTMKKK